MSFKLKAEEAMRELDPQLTYLVSGGIDYQSLLDLSFFIAGAYVGTSVAYLEPLMEMTMTINAIGVSTTYIPCTAFIVSGAILGGAIGIGLSHVLQAGINYFSEPLS